MNKYEWADMDAKYAIGKELWKIVRRAEAYEEFRSRLEVFDANNYAESMGNDGRDLYDVTAEQVEQIIDNYLESDELMWCADEQMNEAILTITGIYC